MKEILEISEVPDIRRANKAEAAEFFDVTLPSLEAWFRRGCPIIQRGGRGVSWILDLHAIAKWRYDRVNSDGDRDDPEKMKPKDRLDWYKGSREAMRHQEEEGKLIKAETFESEIADIVKTVSVTLESLPDVLERDAGLDGAGVERAQIVLDRVREDLYEKLNAG